MKGLVSALLAMCVALAGAPLWARNAPDFSLPGPDGKQISLSSQRGKLVVVEFLNPT